MRTRLLFLATGLSLAPIAASIAYADQAAYDACYNDCVAQYYRDNAVHVNSVATGAWTGTCNVGLALATGLMLPESIPAAVGLTKIRAVATLCGLGFTWGFADTGGGNEISAYNTSKAQCQKTCAPKLQVTTAPAPNVPGSYTQEGFLPIDPSVAAGEETPAAPPIMVPVEGTPAAPPPDVPPDQPITTKRGFVVPPDTKVIEYTPSQPSTPPTTTSQNTPDPCQQAPDQCQQLASNPNPPNPNPCQPTANPCQPTANPCNAQLYADFAMPPPMAADRVMPFIASRPKLLLRPAPTPPATPVATLRHNPCHPAAANPCHPIAPATRISELTLHRNPCHAVIGNPAAGTDKPAASSANAIVLQPRTFGQRPGGTQLAGIHTQPNPCHPSHSPNTAALQHTAKLTPSGQHVSGSTEGAMANHSIAHRSRGLRTSFRPAHVVHHGSRHFTHVAGRRSDVRLKEDIVLLARLDSGISLYRFRYKGSDRSVYVGVMAQEVETIVPSAVTRGHDGYLRVDYAKLGIRFMSFNEWLARSRHASQARQ
jgi:hypothetical protein